MDGALMPGELLVCVSYVTNMYKPIRNLAKLTTKFSKAAVSNGSRCSRLSTTSRRGCALLKMRAWLAR